MDGNAVQVGPECLSKSPAHMAETSILSITVLPGPLPEIPPMASWGVLQSQLVKDEKLKPDSWMAQICW